MRAHRWARGLSASAFCGLAVAAVQPAAAQTAFNCGTLTAGTTFGDAAYTSGIIVAGTGGTGVNGAVHITIPGVATTGTTISRNNQIQSAVVAVTRPGANWPINITIGGTGPVRITPSGTATNYWHQGRGVLASRRSGGETGTVKMNIGTSGTPVTIGTATGRVTTRGIAVQKYNLSRDANSGDVCIATAATIYANWEAIFVDDDPMTGAITVYNTGNLTAGGRGIYARNHNGGSGDVTVTNLGAIVTGNEAIHAASNSQRTVSVSVENSGALGTATGRVSNGIYALHQRGAAGTVSVSNSGDITASGWGIRAHTQADSGADVTVGLTGGTIDANGDQDAVKADLEGMGGSITMTVAGGATVVSRRHAGIAARMTHADNAAGTVAVTQGGTITARTGVLAYVAHGSTTETVAPRASQPLIDVTWTGSFSHGTTATVAADDTGRRVANDADEALVAARAADAEDATRHGQAAGIEAFVLNPWNLATTVAAGDDPEPIADAAVQTALLAASGADSMRAEILAAFKAALGNADVAVAARVFDAIKTGATSLDDVTDAEIVTFLGANNAGRRTFLRNVLAHSLSEAEKRVLQALATDTGLDAALTAAGFMDPRTTRTIGAG